MPKYKEFNKDTSLAYKNTLEVEVKTFQQFIGEASKPSEKESHGTLEERVFIKAPIDMN